MKKIMFSDKFGLTEAVQTGRKTVTRRIVPKEAEIDALTYCTARGLGEKDIKEYILRQAPYKVGDIIAVCMSYEHIYEKYVLDEELIYQFWNMYRDTPGWNNKMFVKAEECPVRIRITGVCAERLQDISDEDCLKEGVFKYDEKLLCDVIDLYNPWPPYVKPYKLDRDNLRYRCSARSAFSILIDKINGRGTWKKNPLVYRYEFHVL